MGIWIVPLLILVVFVMPIVSGIHLVRSILGYKRASDESDKSALKKKLNRAIIMAVAVLILEMILGIVWAMWVIALSRMT